MCAQRLAPVGGAGLAWPREAALLAAPAGELLAAGSNVVLDLHGDPLRARLCIFSDGNHHMALADVVAAFASGHPAVVDVFYATTPPRILTDALATGCLSLGNLQLSVRPHVLISPRAILDRLHGEGAIGSPATFAASSGTAILVRKGNPLAIRTVADLLRGDVRLALSNPVTEAASFEVYSTAIAAAAERLARPHAATITHLMGDAVVKSRLIHHREIPELLATGRADASLVYTHLALRYTRVFPDLLDMQDGTPEPVTRYGVAIVRDGGDFGPAFAAFLLGAEAGRIYAAHGLLPEAQPV